MRRDLGALTLHQPWASLMVPPPYEVLPGVTPWPQLRRPAPPKTIETRDWGTGYRGRLAIHAAKQPIGGAGFDRDFVEVLAVAFGIVEALPADAAISRDALMRTVRYLHSLPSGAVLGTVEVIDCVQVVAIREEPGAGAAVDIVKHRVDGRPVNEAEIRVLHVDALEFALGNYELGRVLWLTKDAQPFPAPIPTRGQQGLWSWRQP